MAAAASYLQDVQAHREACAFLRVFVCFCVSVMSVSQSVCLWMLPASACVQVLLGRHALHAYERAHEGVSVCTEETIAQSQRVTLGPVPQRFSVRLGPSLFVDKRML